MMLKFPEYAGMSYECASRAAAALLERRGWFHSFERLAVLREIMIREMDRACGISEEAA